MFSVGCSRVISHRATAQYLKFSTSAVFLREPSTILNLDSPRRTGRENVVNLGKTERKNKEERSKKIRWTAGSVGLLAVPALVFSLGCWQVLRLGWKLELIESLKSRLSEKAIDFPVNDISRIDDLEYRRLRITGEFLHGREFTISPRGRFDEGYKQKDAGSLLSDSNMSSHGAHVITPFKIADTDLVIMVNRGWVPVHKMSRESRKDSEPNGTISLEVIGRKSEKRPQFVGQNILEQGVWFYKDFDQMAQYYGTAPIYVEAVSESTLPGGPIGGQTNVSVRNDHLSYLITWYSLTVVTVLMWLVRFRK